MLIGVTGAAGFLGRYIVGRLATTGHHCRCWRRPESDCGGLENVADRVEWREGSVGAATGRRAQSQACAKSEALAGAQAIPCAASQRSASIAAMHPVPAAVTAWR
jgi:nucleoside-diphosphate-sugar epimerase